MSQEPTIYYSLADAVTISEFDSNEGDRPLLVTARKKHYALSGVAGRTVSCFDGRALNIQDLNLHLHERYGCQCNEQELTDILIGLTHAGIVSLNGNCAVLPRPSSKRPYFAFRIPLLPPRTIRPITIRLARLMSPGLITYMLPPLLIFQCIICWTHRTLLTTLIHRPLRGEELVLLLLGSYAGLLLHELGHASACVRYGAKPGPIGLCLYLIFPAFYTDVTDAWHLVRWQRAIVDAGGIYVSLLAAAGAYLLYVTNGIRDFMLLSWAYTATVLFNLNPFMRADGYWLFSDALGVANLMTLNRRISLWLLRRIRGQKDAPPYLLVKHQRLGRFYIGYYLLFVLFWIWGLYGFFWWYLPRIVSSYPGLLAMAFRSIRFSGFSAVALKAILQLVATSIPLMGLTIYSARFIVRHVWRRRRTA